MLFFWLSFLKHFSAEHWFRFILCINLYTLCVFIQTQCILMLSKNNMPLILANKLADYLVSTVYFL